MTPSGPLPDDQPPGARPIGRRPLDSPPLLALGTAAVLAVYTAGWARTQEAVAGPDSGRAGRQMHHRGPISSSESGLPTSGASHVSDDHGNGTNRLPDAPTTSGRPSSTAAPASPEITPSAIASLAAVEASPPEVVAPVPAGGATSVLPVSAPPTAAPPIPSPPASAPPPPVPAAPLADPLRTDSAASRAVVGWRDGTYAGWGSSRHGDIEATVVIEQGRIVAASISRCLTRYSCSWIAHLQPQVVTRQSPEVDNVSGATESADAFYYAVVDALKKAK